MQIWKGSDEYCWRYRADTILSTDGRTDRWNQYTPFQLRWSGGGGIITWLGSGLAGFFHLVEETGLNPGLNRPGRNRFLPPEVEETGKNWKKVWNAWLSKYQAVILKTNETRAKNVLNINTLLLFLPREVNQKLWWLPGRNRFLPLEVEETGVEIKQELPGGSKYARGLVLLN